MIQTGNCDHSKGLNFPVEIVHTHPRMAECSGEKVFHSEGFEGGLSIDEFFRSLSSPR